MTASDRTLNICMSLGSVVAEDCMFLGVAESRDEWWQQWWG